MVVRVDHIHANIYPFVMFPAIDLAPLVIASGIEAHSVIANIFEFLCRRTSRISISVAVVLVALLLGLSWIFLLLVRS